MRSLGTSLFALSFLLFVQAHAHAAKYAEQKAYCKDHNCHVLPNGNILAKCHFGEMEYRWRDRFTTRNVRSTCKP